jgi:hypothetical protein
MDFNAYLDIFKTYRSAKVLSKLNFGSRKEFIT